jgi:quercetin dioxygenase-like cupin family protein
MKATENKERFMVLTDIITVLVSNRDTGNEYAVFEEKVPPLGGPPPHMHPDEEIFYVVKGEFEFILNDPVSPFKVLPGSVIHVPSNALHTFKNTGSRMGKMIVILSPGKLLDYFRAIGTSLDGISSEPDLDVVPDFSKLDVSKAFEQASNHNIKFVLPEIMKD